MLRTPVKSFAELLSHHCVKMGQLPPKYLYSLMTLFYIIMISCSSENFQKSFFLQPERLTFLVKVCLCSIQFVSILVLKNVEMKKSVKRTLSISGHVFKKKRKFSHNLCSAVPFCFFLKQFQSPSPFVQSPLHRSEHIESIINVGDFGLVFI